MSSPTAQNLALMFFNQARGLQKKVALRFKKEGLWQDVTYGQFAETVQHLSLGLKKGGIQKGDRVAILSENRPEWFYADLAILSLGAVSVPIYATSAPKECTYILNHTEARILFISTQEQWFRLKNDLMDCRSLKTIISFDEMRGFEDVEFFEDWIEEGHKLESEDLGAWKDGLSQIKGEDLATIIYTSGTTGEPKGVMLSHANLLSNCWASRRAIGIHSGDILLSFLPLSHIFERMAGFYLQILIGTTVAFAESMKTVAQNMPEVKPTVMDAVPRFFEKFRENVSAEIGKRGPWAVKIFNACLNVGRSVSRFKQAGQKPPLHLEIVFALINILVFSKIKRRLGGRIRFFISGGAPLSRDLAEYFHAMGIMILEGYGLTETSPVISVNREDQFKFGSVGMPLEDVRIRIAEDGEILVKSPGVMKGYYKNEEATRAVMKEDWFATGDIGRFDSEGFLYITDRKKDLIKTSGGKYISPQKIEHLLTQEEWVEQAFVYGDQRKFVVGLIVPNFSKLEKYARENSIPFSSRKDLVSSSTVSEEFDRRVSRLQRDLAEFEKVKYFALLPGEMTLETGELTATLKMKRRVVVEKYRDVIEKMYADAELHPK